MSLPFFISNSQLLAKQYQAYGSPEYVDASA
jgi:hypothetical protein